MDRVASGSPATIGLALMLGTAGCDLEPCGELDLSASHTRGAQDTHGAPPTVIAVSDGAQVRIVRTCSGPDCGMAEIEVQQLELDGVPDQLMLTAEGQLTYRVNSTVKRVAFEGSDQDPGADPGAQPGAQGIANDVYEIIGALRSGDWLIYRKLAHTANAGGEPGEPSAPSDTDEQHREPSDELWALYAGDQELLPAEIPTNFRLGDAGVELRVAAIGHRHVIARELLGDGREELYLIRVVPALQFDHLGDATRGKALRLGRGDAFRRVFLTEGPSPADFGEQTEFAHHVPTDAEVIATSGQGADARTLIYSVANTRQIANFAGEVVTSTRPLESIPGMRPVSPSGTHLAYIAPSGALALRDLDTHQACELRPPASGQHLLAGFAADGTLYFESREGPHEELVYAYDASSREFEQLTSREHWRLQAVPARRHFVAALGQALPWALVGNDGIHDSSSGVTKNKSLGSKEVSFLPRGDETLWMIEAEAGTAQEDSKLHLRRVEPEYDGARVTLDMKSAPLARDQASTDSPAPFVHEYSSSSTQVCVSASQSASRTTPWATQCSEPDDPERFLDNGLPSDELGF